MSSEPTNFTEANALLAVVREDWIEAARLIDGMLPGERLSLGRYARDLAHLCSSENARAKASIGKDPIGRRW